MGRVLKRTREELRQMDLKTRKLTIHKDLLPCDDIDILDESRKRDVATFKIAWMHQYKNSMIILKSAKKDLLRRPITTLTA